MLTITVRDDFSESRDFYDGLKKEYSGAIETIIGREGAIGPDVVISMFSGVGNVFSGVSEVITKIGEYKKGVRFEVQKDGVTVSGRVGSPEELEAYLIKIKNLL